MHSALQAPCEVARQSGSLPELEHAQTGAADVDSYALALLTRPHYWPSSMFTFLLLGFAIGIRHALEADHVAAVVSLATRGGSMARQAAQGALWGLGHTLTLLAVAGVCIGLGVAIPASAERAFEALVGAMLVLLGVSVFLRLRRQHIHFHAHRHTNGEQHFHAHAHATEHDKSVDAHDHIHNGVHWQAVAVGAVHGVAGSAALVLITVQATRSAWLGLVYIALFGLGSVLGMMALAAVIALPLGASARRRTRTYQWMCAGAGTFSLLLGARMLWSFATLP